jgi:hypothetical protein
VGTTGVNVVDPVGGGDEGDDGVEPHDVDIDIIAISTTKQR